MMGLKINQEAVKTSAIVVSLLFAACSFVFSIIDRFSQSESLVVAASAEASDYQTRLFRLGSRLYYDAKYNVILSNISAKPISVVDMDAWFKEKQDGKFKPQTVPFGHIISGKHFFEPLNLAPGQSTVVSVTIPFPLSNDCQFKDLPITNNLSRDSIVEIFSKNQRTFPMCRDVTDFSRLPTDYFFDSFNGPYFTAKSATGRRYESNHFTFVEAIPSSETMISKLPKYPH